MQERFISFVAEVFGVDPGLLSMGTAYESLPQWDSLMQLRLVAEIEDEFDVDIPIDEVPDIKTLGDFYSYIERA